MMGTQTATVIWQKARIIVVRPGGHLDDPLLEPIEGMEVWVRAERPVATRAPGTLTGRTDRCEVYVLAPESAREIAQNLHLARAPYAIERDGVELLDEFRTER